MPDVSKRASGRKDILSSLKACPYCLGDLEFVGAAGGGYYACLQCGARDRPHEHGPSWRFDSPLMQTPGSLSSADALLNRVPF